MGTHSLPAVDDRPRLTGAAGRHRGETLTPAEEKREHALIAKHAKDWMGPLHGVLLKMHNVFRRGFIEEGCLVPRGPALG